MEKHQVRDVVLGVLREVQKISGREWSKPGPDDQPIGALVGFDSLSGIEATVMMASELGCDLGTDSIFVSADGKRALTLDEIALRVGEIVSAKGVTA